MLNEREIQVVQDSWDKVIPIADTAMDLFYNRLFEVAPATRGMFPVDMTDQKRRLAETLTLAVSNLDDLDAVVPILKGLGQRHAHYGAQPEHYVVVGEVLLWTLEQGLGDAFTDETRAAWSKVYGLVSDTMQEAALQEVGRRG